MAADDICFPCSVGITHTCPICQAVVQGSGNAPCYPCSQRRRPEHQIDEEAATIPIRWMSGMFIAFCRGRIPLDDDLASERIARAAEACRAIAAADPAYGRITTDDVHAAIGAEAAQRVTPLIEFMCDVGVLEWDRARLKVLVENDRIEAILTAHQDSPHASLLRQYRDDLAARGRKPVTQQTALAAAAALLAVLGDAPLAKLSQRHLARALRKSPGQRASLKGFLSFVARQGGAKLTIPPLHTLDPVEQGRQLRADIRAWRKRLKNPRSRAEARALIALLITGIYALPLSRVLALRRDEVGMVSSGIVLWPDADAVVVEHPLAASYLRWTPLYGPWVFPGRHEHKPLSEAGVAYHLADKAKALPRDL